MSLSNGQEWHLVLPASEGRVTAAGVGFQGILGAGAAVLARSRSGFPLSAQGLHAASITPA